MIFNKRAPLYASSGSISRIGVGFFLAKGSFGHRCIHRLPFPVQTYQRTIVEQTLCPQRAEIWFRHSPHPITG